MIEYIEELGPELESKSLSDGYPFGEGQVELLKARSFEDVAARGAIRSRKRLHEGIWIEVLDGLSHDQLSGKRGIP